MSSMCELVQDTRTQFRLLSLRSFADNFDPYNVLLAIATNIPVQLMTGFVVQGQHIKFVLFRTICPINLYQILILGFDIGE